MKFYFTFLLILAFALTLDFVSIKAKNETPLLKKLRIQEHLPVFGRQVLLKHLTANFICT